METEGASGNGFRVASCATVDTQTETPILNQKPVHLVDCFFRVVASGLTHYHVECRQHNEQEQTIAIW